MDYRKFAERNRGILILIATMLAVAICVLIILEIASPVSAAVFVYGSMHNYSVNVLPEYSYVHQGENISQGSYYDLSGVYGWSGYLGMWDYDDDVGFAIPDHYVSLNNGNARKYLIDPEKMPVGTWYQIDSFSFEDLDSYKSSFGNSNSVAFHVVGSRFARDVSGKAVASPDTTVVVRYDNITRYDGETIVHIPVTITAIETVPEDSSFVPAAQEVVITITPTEQPSPEETDSEGNAIPTAKEAALPPALLALALLAVIIWRRS